MANAVYAAWPALDFSLGHQWLVLADLNLILTHQGQVGLAGLGLDTKPLTCATISALAKTSSRETNVALAAS
jgi:hypothetical protein